MNIKVSVVFKTAVNEFGKYAVIYAFPLFFSCIQGKNNPLITAAFKTNIFSGPNFSFLEFIL
jgi:hypothetical protein